MRAGDSKRSSRRSAIALGVLAAFAVVLGACFSRMTVMPGASHRGEPPPLDADGAALAAALRADVEHLATTIGERNLDHAPGALEQAAAFVRQRLTSLGYSVESQPFRVGERTVENLVAERRGASLPTELVIVGAHYDSAPGTPGADDNASGVAVALALAARFASESPARTVRFVFFTNEEPPWFETASMGSEVYARAAKARGDDVRAMLALETMGMFSTAPGSQHYPWPFSSFYPSTGDFIAFVGDSASRDLVRDCVRVFREQPLVASEGAALPAFIEGAAWSDHAPFWRQGYRALMVTDTAPFRNPRYHERNDLPDTLDYPRLARVTQGLVHVLRALARPAGS